MPSQDAALHPSLPGSAPGKEALAHTSPSAGLSPREASADQRGAWSGNVCPSCNAPGPHARQQPCFPVTVSPSRQKCSKAQVLSYPGNTISPLVPSGPGVAEPPPIMSPWAPQHSLLAPLTLTFSLHEDLFMGTTGVSPASYQVPSDKYDCVCVSTRKDVHARVSVGTAGNRYTQLCVCLLTQAHGTVFP